MISAKEKFEICETILRILDGSVSEGEFKRFEKLLAENEEVRYLYILMLEAFTHLQKPGDSFKMNVIAETAKDGFNSELWQLLAKDEIESPSVDVPQMKSVPEKIQICKDQDVYAGHRYNKTSLVSIMLSAAAILLLVIFVYFAPVRDTSYGQITDHRQVVLKDMKSSIHKGKILRNESLILENGILEVLMDGGSTILLEAPAEMRLEDDNQIFLVQGKLTAKVPRPAIGFTVRTPSASVVDYGTEFGILVDQYANTEAHVLKGQVEMRLGSNIRVFDKALRLSANQAGRTSGQNLESIPSSVHQFTYAMPSPFEYYARLLEPVMYFRVKGSAVDSFHDIMQNSGLSIELNNDAVSISPGPDWGGHTADCSLHFTGEDRGVCVKNVQSIRQHQQGAYTICFWICFDHIAEQIVYANHVSGPTEDSQYYRIVSMDKEGNLEHSAYRNDRGKWRTVKSPLPLKPNTWYFVAISNAFRTTKNMYINGQYVADDSAIQTTPLETYQTFEFGGNRDSFAGFEGSMGDVLLFSRVLSEKEIRSLYESATNAR